MQKLEALPSVSQQDMVDNDSLAASKVNVERLSPAQTTQSIERQEIHRQNSVTSDHDVIADPDASANGSGPSSEINGSKVLSNQSLSLALSPQTQAGDRTPADRQATQVFKVIILGDPGVGKTCLTYRLCMGTFLQKGNSTVGVDFRKKTIQVGSQLVKVINCLELLLRC